jgi:hypothetical protein
LNIKIVVVLVNHSNTKDKEDNEKGKKERNLFWLFWVFHQIQDEMLHHQDIQTVAQQLVLLLHAQSIGEGKVFRKTMQFGNLLRCEVSQLHQFQ